MSMSVISTRIRSRATRYTRTSIAAASGGVVLTLQTPDGQDDDSEECQDIDKTLAQQLIQNPQNYYVNVHTGPFPNGAVRGQLKT